MKYFIKRVSLAIGTMILFTSLFAQPKEDVKIRKVNGENKINIYIGGKLFTSFLYPDTLEKPVLYPVYTADEIMVTRGFPIDPLPGESKDHPHHLGIWFNFENVNGLDFWNNSYAIPKVKRSKYGWIRTGKIVEIKNGKKGILSYHANWTNQQNKVLLEENTKIEFSGSANRRIIDRVTVLKADTVVTFTDAKDGMLGIRLARALQMPVTNVQPADLEKVKIAGAKDLADTKPTGNYITSEGKEGDDAWSSRARWCKVYGKIGKDSVSIAIIDHPKNVNYPTFWHARGYGLFAANPLGERIFTNGKSYKDLQLKKGDSVIFLFRIVIDEGAKTISSDTLNRMADEFAEEY